MKKRDLAGHIVAKLGRYMPDAPRLCYHVRAGGRFFAAPDVEQLAELLVKEFSQAKLAKILADTY